MKANIYIGDDYIGSTNFRISDESMGAVIGQLIPCINYDKYKSEIQLLTASKGIANVSDFNFAVELGQFGILVLAGGIGITDHQDFDEILVEAAGLKEDVVEWIKNCDNG